MGCTAASGRPGLVAVVGLAVWGSIAARAQGQASLVATNSSLLAGAMAQQSCTEIILDPSGEGVRSRLGSTSAAPPCSSSFGLASSCVHA